MRKLATLALTLAASPAFAATEYGFFSLHNTNFIVLLAFLLVVGLLVYFGVPGKLTALLDQRADGIRRDLAEARALREEAQTLVASFDRKRQEMAAQAERIVADARAEAERAAAQARADAAQAVQRRIAGAEEQIAAAQAKALREVRDRAITVAIAAAQEVLARQMTPTDRARLVDQSIATVAQRLN
ncbi:ATP F0F1 synthase subunit B [Rubellimicrobium aerolatum]|uniref:ATP synthase subunit b n=1 Tax=Rubellimicrobium aerolatum TaxID=490979 RepID=A0ABW0SG27_9RHOB|nr:ATP F0F1 synthase subunit B [Rubellimicrobium aerolatum]MBP1805827.1 F-type H+-transporting ATPase subunit b [Rubellimicrobium aerolatum]